MVENVVTAVFEVESEAYQALSMLRHNAINNGFTVSQAAIIKRENGAIVTKDWFDTGIETTNDSRFGGLLGALVGVIGGPIGMLLGGGWGYLVGNIVDARDASDNLSVFERVSGQLVEGETAMLVLVQEHVPGTFAKEFEQFKTNTIVEDAAEVAEEVEEAEQLRKEMEKQARKAVRDEKRAARKEEVEAKRKELRDRFKQLGGSKEANA